MEDIGTKNQNLRGGPLGSGQSWTFRGTADGRRRSLAWVVYAIFSAIGLIVVLSHPGSFGFWVGEALLLLYTRYLYRGGRWVIFFWVS